MLLIALDGYDQIHAWHRIVTVKVRYYIEEACGACDTPQCSSFDYDGQVVVEVPVEALKDKVYFEKVIIAGVLDDVAQRHPNHHSIPAEDIILAPTTL